MTDDLPADLTALNLRAWLTNAMGLCACAEFEPFVAELREFLRWHATDPRDRICHENLLGGNLGLFYIFAGILEKCGLSEHGASIRGSWLTKKGGLLLDALDVVTAEEIEGASGEAYDGLWYPSLGN